MKRFLWGLSLAVAVVTVGCDGELSVPDSASLRQPAVYDAGGVAVFRLIDNDDQVVVRFMAVVVLEDGIEDRVLTIEEAYLELADEALVRPIYVYQTADAATVLQQDPSTLHVPSAESFRNQFRTLDDGDPLPETCPCYCCSGEPPICHCSWGCLKLCL